ncbi:MAG TPA: DUF4388 domain-containing protein [Polyangiaceae bacterium]|nr:DUF4388 domain-containing protein [Polyangiaceae bacterium]
MNRPPARGPEATNEDGLDDGFDTLDPLTPPPARGQANADARPPWGRLEGFSTLAVLRLLEAERKTCTVTLQEGGRRALVHLRAGVPVHAESGSFTGRPALDDLLGWPDPVVSIARLRYEGAPTFEPRLPLASGPGGSSGPVDAGPTEAAAGSGDTAGVEAPGSPTGAAAEGLGASAGPPGQGPAAGADGRAPTPYARLLRLTEAGETGELVVAREADEFHVHLQRGHVVWVAGRQTRERFREHLLAVAGTRNEELQPVLEECRRARLPLVETLVRRNLATPEQLRETFAAVFREALAELRALAEADCVFLRRGAEARHDLSFSLRGLEPSPDLPSINAPPPDADARADAPSAPDESPPPPDVGERAARARVDVPATRDSLSDSMTPAPRAVRLPPMVPASPDAGAASPATLKAETIPPLAAELTASLPVLGDGHATPGGTLAGNGPVTFSLDALMAALDAEGVPVEGACLTRGLAIVPGASAPSFVPSPGLLDLMGGPATDRAELVILRAPDATTIGQRIGARPLVAWCRTRPELYAPAQALLARLGGSPLPAPRAPARSASRPLRVHHDRLPTDASAELHKLFTDNADLLSALVVDGGARSYLAVDGPAAPPLTWMLRRALSSAGAFGPRGRESAPDADAAPLLGARFVEGWWFGGPLLREPGHYGWLLLQPAAAQALGWLMAGRFCRRFGLQPLATLDA